MKIKNVLISQNPPLEFEKTPYFELTQKYSINIDFFKFFQLEGISGIDFRKSKINVLDYEVVVFSSKNTIDLFFQLLKDLRVEMSEETKYLCATDAVAHYLQKYVQYRKRKILFGKNNNPNGIYDLFLKNKALSMLIPGGEDNNSSSYAEFMEKNGIKFTQATIFRAVPANLKEKVKLENYDMIVFFSPHGVSSLLHNFPDFKQKDMVFAALGQNTANAIQEAGLRLDIMSSTKESSSISEIISLFLKDHATRKR